MLQRLNGSCNADAQESEVPEDPAALLDQHLSGQVLTIPTAWIRQYGAAAQTLAAVLASTSPEAKRRQCFAAVPRLAKVAGLPTPTVRKHLLKLCSYTRPPLKHADRNGRRSVTYEVRGSCVKEWRQTYGTHHRRAPAAGGRERAEDVERARYMLIHQQGRSEARDWTADEVLSAAGVSAGSVADGQQLKIACRYVVLPVNDRTECMTWAERAIYALACSRAKAAVRSGSDKMRFSLRYEDVEQILGLRREAVRNGLQALEGNAVLAKLPRAGVRNAQHWTLAPVA